MCVVLTCIEERQETSNVARNDNVLLAVRVIIHRIVVIHLAYHKFIAEIRSQ